MKSESFERGNSSLTTTVTVTRIESNNLITFVLMVTRIELKDQKYFLSRSSCGSVLPLCTHIHTHTHTHTHKHTHMYCQSKTQLGQWTVPQPLLYLSTKDAIASMVKKLLHRCIGAHARAHVHSLGRVCMHFDRCCGYHACTGVYVRPVL